MHQADTNSKRVSKAGIILFDRGEAASTPAKNPHVWEKKPELKVLTTYTQGRFDDHGIYLVPPKGSIDLLQDKHGKTIRDENGNARHELPVIAAMRECREETGIDIQKLLGKRHYAAFLKGESITGVKSPGYPGIEIVHALADPVKDHIYVSGHGSSHRVQYFAIEIRGIEKLQASLKCIVPGEHALKPHDRLTSKHLAKKQGLPSFEQMMDILRTGIVPVVKGAPWSNRSPKRILAHPVLADAENAWLNEHHGTHDILSHKEWLEFIADPALGKNYKAILANIESLKEYMTQKKLIGDCVGCMKMDTKDDPLNFYKEGGFIGPLGEVLHSMETMAEKNSTYARAVWGEYAGARKGKATVDEQMLRAQIAPFVEYLAALSPMEVASAAIVMPKNMRAQNASEEAVALHPRAMRAVAAIVEPVVSSPEWQGKIFDSPGKGKVQSAHKAACLRRVPSPASDQIAL